MELTFKVKRTEGVCVRPNCDWVKYVGKSRTDGFPVFRLKYDEGPSLVHIIKDALIVNTKPGYTVQSHEIETVNSWKDSTPIKSLASELIAVQPMSAPNGNGILYYIDYVYDQDERLLLMM
jgi:hypothetical protein